MSNSADFCLVVLIGLPGSGKSFFCQKYCDFAQKNGFNCVHVCYDNLIPISRQDQLTQEQGKWKLEREKIVKAVESFMKNEDDNENSYLSDIKSSVTSEVKPGEKIILLIDDNNYLPSMRYQYFQLARKCTAGFAQLHFSCDINLAKSRNRSRSEEQVVPDQVIDTMSSKLEAPNPFSNKWEAFSFTIQVNETLQFENLDTIQAIINAAAENPVKEVTPNVSEEEREKDRVVCNANVIHQSDKLLRTLVNKKMISLKKNCQTKDDMSVAGKRIYSVKNELLEDLKTGFTKIDKNLLTSVQNREAEGVLRLESELEQLFKEKLELNMK